MRVELFDVVNFYLLIENTSCFRGKGNGFFVTLQKNNEKNLI